MPSKFNVSELLLTEDNGGHEHEDIDQFRMMPKERVRSIILKEFQFESEAYDLEGKIEKLKKEVSSLRSQLYQKVVTSRGDAVYEKLLPEMAEKFDDKIVAIDIESERVVGVGETIEEAYEKARSECPEKRQFYFRRVGRSYVERLR